MEQQKELQKAAEEREVGGVSTFTWDTTFTTTYDVVNREIKAKSTYPETFDNSVEAHTLLDYLSGSNMESFYQLLKPVFASGSSVRLKGSWGQWQLEMRGNGNSVYMRLPVTEGAISFGEDSGDLSGGYLIVLVTLLFESQSKADSEKRELVLTQGKTSQVSVIDHSFPKLDPDSDLELIVDGAFKRYLNTEEVLKEFRYVFSTIDINKQATGDFSWMKPSDTGYAVFVPSVNPREEESLFSILCMTENRTASATTQQSVDAQVLVGKTEGANAVLCISPQKLCQKLLITTATKMIVGTTEDDYTYSTDGTEIHNVREITFKDVEVSDGKKVNLKIAANNFSIKVVNDHLELNMIDASYSETLYNAYLNLNQRIEFETKKVDDKTIFALKEGEEFKGTIHAVVEPSDTSKILQWVGVALDILSAVMVFGGITVKAIAKCATTATSAAARITNAAVASVEVEAATAAATRGIAAGAGASRAIMIANRLLAAGGLCTVLGLPMSLVEVISVEIAKGKFDKVPSLEDFAENFLSEISWTGINKTTLLGARLNDALLMDFKLEE